MRGKLSKDVTDGQADGRTSEMSVRRAAWSQLKSFRTIETNQIANVENEISCICIYYPGKTLLYGYYKELFVKNFEDRNPASRHVQNLSQSDVPISVFGILLHKMFVYCKRLFIFLFGRISLFLLNHIESCSITLQQQLIDINAPLMSKLYGDTKWGIAIYIIHSEVKEIVSQTLPGLPERDPLC